MKTLRTTKQHPNAMLKIAVLSDVHGNLPALEAVIADARRKQATVFWNLGDFVGYGPFVDEVVDTLFEICAAQVIGNYDLKVLAFPKKKAKWKKSKKREKFLAFEWAWKKLSKKNARRLDALPLQTIQTAEGLHFLLTHGGPASVDEAIGDQTAPERLKELAAMTDAEVILCGHTHFPFLKTVDETTFINPGSVGRPEGGDPLAAYAILEISADGMQVRFQKVGYDIERLARAIHAAGLPAEFTTMFKSGKNLDQVQEANAESVAIKRPDTEAMIVQARRFARECGYEAGHSEQVVKLAKLLFKKLQPVHALGTYELFLLTYAAILHDIGWVSGQAEHHKKSMQMILDDRTLELHEIDRKLIALIARYHRKALPKSDHPIYGELTADRQQQVQLLGGILRMADGLDRSHMSVVKDVEVEIADSLIEFQCCTQGPAGPEIFAAGKKSDLFENVCGRSCRFFSKPSDS